MNKEVVKNRHGDEFTFTLLENNNIQWSGNFTYHRYGYSDNDVIDFVDPSGGPFISKGMTILNKKIKEFKRNESGYLIITE